MSMKEDIFGNPLIKKAKNYLLKLIKNHISLRKSENNIKELEIKSFLS